MEVRRRFRREFYKAPPTQSTVAYIRKQLEAGASVQNVHGEGSGKRQSSAIEQLLHILHRSPMKSVRQTARETRNRMVTVHRMLKRVYQNSYIPTVINSLNKVHPNRRVKLCEWFLGKCAEDSVFPYKIIPIYFLWEYLKENVYPEKRVTVDK